MEARKGGVKENNIYEGKWKWNEKKIDKTK